MLGVCGEDLPLPPAAAMFDPAIAIGTSVSYAHGVL